MSLKKSRIKGSKASLLKTQSNAAVGNVNDEFEEWKRARQLLRPPDQLPLTDLELKEEIARVLTCSNMQQPTGLIEFNYAQGCFLPKPSPGNTVVLFNINGTTIHKDTEEARRQMAELGEEIEEEEVHIKRKPTIEQEQGDEGFETEDVEDEEPEDADAERGEGKEDEEEAEQPKGPKKKLTNQFNFCERAALTYNNPNRSQETQTLPPARGEFSALVLQWVIFDAYDEDFAIQQREKEKEKKVPIPVKKTTGGKKKISEANEEFNKRLLTACKTLERMINLNTYDDIAKDFRYWEDPSDEFKEEQGTLLPLWKFWYEKTRKSMITDIMWNPWYYDLFVVSFGTFEYKNPAQGAICMFTIKNPSFPEHICLINTIVLCIDVHPKFPFMVVGGLFDGNVVVYNVTESCKVPQYKSNSVLNKHHGIVWKVRWVADLQGGELNFYSVATDGKINHWVLMQNELSLTTIITLYLDKPPAPGPNHLFYYLIGSASTLTFHPTDPNVFLVGTEEGSIYKCSTLYALSYLFVYKAHHMPVYAIDYNKFNSSIFISCSGDWRVKIWENNRPEPLFVFDLGASVGDVEWAPYSSTVFAATTSKGRVYVFDLDINKYKAICKQNVVSKKKSKLTRLSFNVKLPIIIVGDDRGYIHCLKLSPNLRIPCKAPKKQQHLDQFTLQCMKLDKLLSLVREPPVLTPPEDVETIPED